MLLKGSLRKIFPFLFSSQKRLAFGVEESPNQYPLEKARYVVMAEFLRAEYQRLGRPVRVLDIGCSEGMMLLYSKKADVQAEFYGVDILEERKAVALQRGYKDVLLRDVRQCDFLDYRGFFDVVICSHILEHLEEPGDLLRKLNGALSKDGLLIGGVPIGLWIGILWRKYISHFYKRRHQRKALLDRFGHVTFFTLPALKKLLKETGFDTEECRGDYLIRAREFFLEDYKWWFDFNQWYGRLFPGILGCVTFRARKR